MQYYQSSRALSGRRASVSRTVASASAVRVARPVSDHKLSRNSVRRVCVKATEDVAEAEATTANASASGTDSGVKLSGMELARRALEQENVDKATLEEALAALDAEMSDMKSRVAAAETRATELEGAGSAAREQILRLSADFENFRRRTKEEKEALQDSVRGDIVTSLLPVIDNFELARTQVKAETEGEMKINTSYQGLYKQFVEFLRGLGVEAVPSTGTPFDPNVHEAIMQEADSGVPEGTILQEFRKGFRLGDKLLRPAMVKVSKRDEGAGSSEE